MEGAGMESPIPQLIRLADVAQLTTFSPDTIRRWTKQGKFPQPVQASTRVLVWRVCDVQAWLEENL